MVSVSRHSFTVQGFTSRSQRYYAGLWIGPKLGLSAEWFNAAPVWRRVLHLGPLIVWIVKLR